MLAAFVLAAVLPAQAQQQREIAVRGEELQRQIVREQREQVEREHETELLLQRRSAEVARPAHTDEPVVRPVTEAPVIEQPSAPKIRTRPDFSLPLMVRSVAAGLLAGLCAFLLGLFIQRRLIA